MAHSTLNIYLDAPFYVEREEPEETFDGVLREVAVRAGPDTRDLPIQLEASDRTFPLYVVGEAADNLRGLRDRKVRVRGKRIDMSGQGYDVEVWPATISPL